MKVHSDNIESIISDLVYQNLKGILGGSLTFNCELNGQNKIDGYCIYIGEDNGDIQLVFGEFNCRVERSLSEKLTKTETVKGQFEIKYNSQSKEFVNDTFSCGLI